jgi:hypothetical protein
MQNTLTLHSAKCNIWLRKIRNKDEDVNGTPVWPVQTTPTDLLTRQPVLQQNPHPPPKQTMLCLVQKWTAMRSPAHVYQHHLLHNSESISCHEHAVCRFKYK